MWIAGSASCREKGVQDCDELPGVKRLGQEVFPQRAVPLGSLLLIQGGYDHPDGGTGCACGAAEEVQDRSALAIGELEVEDYGVGRLLLEDAQGFAARTYHGDGEPRVAQAEAQYSAYRFVVFDYQYLRRDISRGGRRRSSAG